MDNAQINQAVSQILEGQTAVKERLNQMDERHKRGSGKRTWSSQFEALELNFESSRS